MSTGRLPCCKAVAVTEPELLEGNAHAVVREGRLGQHRGKRAWMGKGGEKGTEPIANVTEHLLWTMQ